MIILNLLPEFLLNAVTPCMSRLFKFHPPPTTTLSSSNSEKSDHESPIPRSARAVLVRFIHGGHLLLDRLDSVLRRPIRKIHRSLLFSIQDGDEYREGIPTALPKTAKAIYPYIGKTAQGGRCVIPTSSVSNLCSSNRSCV